MDENPRLRPLQKNHWDNYRDLNKVVTSDLCQRYQIGLGKICLIDNEVEKVQGCLENTILSSGYTTQDILGLPNLKTGEVRDEAF